MPSATRQAFLLIADIGGFTQFMKLHRMSVNHGKQVVVELLKAVISAGAAPLKLAEIEGDAAFFYAVLPEEKEKVHNLHASLQTHMLEMFRAFYRVRRNLSDLRLCVCDACLGMNNLRLKIIVHAGEVALERIAQFEKLFGLDVIVVHRLLKSGLRMTDYVLMTEAAHQALGDFCALTPEKRNLDCDGVGQVSAAVFYPSAQLIGAPQMAEAARSSFLQKIRLAIKMDSRFVRELLGFAKPQMQLDHSRSLLDKQF